MIQQMPSKDNLEIEFSECERVHFHLFVEYEKLFTFGCAVVLCEFLSINIMIIMFLVFQC